jgi:hypothetical protein
MKRSVLVALAAVLVAIVAWLVLRPSDENVAMDLVAEFPNAVEKRPTPDVFKVMDATLAGVTKPAIHVEVASRVAWSVTVPDNGWLSVSAGLLEPAWTMGGDGVLFRASVNDDEILNVVINPSGNPADRHWQEFMLDLSEYSGETVRIYLKTNAGPPGTDDRTGDLAVWGEPRIIRR